MLEVRRMARPFQHHQLALHIGAHIIERVFQRPAHPGLACEVDDARHPLACKGRIESRLVGNVDVVKGKAGMAAQAGQPRLLQGDGIIGVEIINADHLFATRDQGFRHMIADETCRTRDQNCHNHPPRRQRHSGAAGP